MFVNSWEFGCYFKSDFLMGGVWRCAS